MNKERFKPLSMKESLKTGLSDRLYELKRKLKEENKFIEELQAKVFELEKLIKELKEIQKTFVVHRKKENEFLKELIEEREKEENLNVHCVRDAFERIEKFTGEYEDIKAILEKLP